jgi:membrane protein
MDRSLAEFGPLGPVFTLPSWLITVSLVAVAGLAAGRMVASSHWFTRLTGRPPDLKSPDTGDAL